jgi:hypothetical protein
LSDPLFVVATIAMPAASVVYVKVFAVDSPA